MKAYKGFNKDLQCRDFQYEIGKKYKEDKAVVCVCGFHSCLNPMDVFGYYAPTDNSGNLNRFCEVEIPEKMDKSDDDSKVATNKIEIGAEIGIKGLIEAGVHFIMERVNWDDNKISNTGNRSAATNTGDRSAATNTGDRSAATNTGDRSAATNTGNWSAATNTGRYSAATNTGNWSAATNTGRYSAATNTGRYSAATNTGKYSAATNTGCRSAATNTGDYSAATNTGCRSAATNTGCRSAATNTGDYSAATNTGDYSAASVEGEDSVAIVTGYKGRAKGALGCYIVVAERDDDHTLIDVKAARVDGKIIKANTYYALVNGGFIRCEE